MNHAGGKQIRRSMGPLIPDRKYFTFPPAGLIFLVFPFLFGCVALTAKPAVVSTVVTEPAVGVTDSAPAPFGLVGRVSVRDKKQGFSGGINWHHSATGDEIFLFSPLGQTVAQIQRDVEGIRLITAEQKIYYATDAESLTEQVLGWRLPLMGLQYWVQSMNSPATAATMDRDINEQVIAIRQDGWEITYSSYFPPEQATQLPVTRPRVLTLKRNDLQIKLVVDNWKIE